MRGTGCSEPRSQRPFLEKWRFGPCRQLLQEAFGVSHSVGWISELLTEAGERAGCILTKAPLATLGPVLVVRDEKFFQNKPILMVIEPVSAAILGIWALLEGGIRRNVPRHEFIRCVLMEEIVIYWIR